LLLSLLVLSLLAPSAWAEKDRPANLAHAVAPYLDESTVAVLRIDLAALDLDALKKPLLPLLKQHLGSEDFPPPAISESVARLKEGGVRQVYLVYSLAGLFQGPPLLVLLLEKGSKSKALAEGLTESKQFHPMQFEARTDTVVGGPEAVLQRLAKQKPTPRPELAQAFEALGPGTAHLIVAWSKDGRRIIEEVLPNLPDELGGQSSKVLTRGLKWVGVRIQTQPKLGLDLIVQAADAENALALKKLFQQAHYWAGHHPVIKNAVANFDKMKGALTPEVNKDQLVLHLQEDALVAMAEKPLDQVRTAQQRTLSSNNLKQLALAMHNYHDANKGFPAQASLDKQGKPLLSWRVHLLPYLAEEELYKEFHLDEPWDSEHNKKLIARMPPVFTSPGLKAEAGKTTYLAPVGPDTLFAGPKGLKISEITDGTANTIMLVEAADDRAVIWTKPDDLTIDPKQPLRGLGLKYNDAFLAALCDGSVRIIPKTIDANVLKAAFTPRGGD
jgi:hypothetical protein